jgi:hypothetical protein
MKSWNISLVLCSKHGEKNNAYKNLVGILNLIREIRFECVIQAIKDRVKGLSLVNTVMNLWDSNKRGIEEDDD